MGAGQDRLRRKANSRQRDELATILSERGLSFPIQEDGFRGYLETSTILNGDPMEMAESSVTDVAVTVKTYSLLAASEIAYK